MAYKGVPRRVPSMPTPEHNRHAPALPFLSPRVNRQCMSIQTKLSRTIREWATYLEDQGHLVATAFRGGSARPFDLISINLRGEPLLWKIVLTRQSAKRFTKQELNGLLELIGLADGQYAKPYLVVRFDKPRDKVLTVPAELAFAEEMIRADLNGKDWPPHRSGR